MSEILGEGKYLRLIKYTRGWEFVERTNPDGAVVIVAMTNEGKILFVEQFRPPIGKTVIEFPAGLVGDTAEFEGEPLAVAAERELLEETGYAAEQMEYLTHGPPTAGLSSENVTFFRASGLRRVAEGGGDESEEIDIHEIAPSDVPAFLERAEKRGAAIDPKIFAGLFFLGGAPLGPDRQSITIDLPSSDARRQDSPSGLALEDALFQKLDEDLPPLPDSGRVGILGGTFNPPHVGHALLAHAMLATEKIDALWIVPVFEHPFGKDSAKFEERVDMCRLAFEKLGDRVRVIEIERDLPKPSYTVQTLSTLHAVRPGIAPTLIIGSDIVPELPRWQSPEFLTVLSRIVVVPRQGAPLLEPSDLDVKIYRGFSLPKVSSTAIKVALKSGHSVDGLLDRTVVSYIEQNGLYA